MRTKSILSIIVLTAVTMTAGINEAEAATSVQVNTPGLNFSLNDYQPPPPNVHVYQNEGRPYYIERDQRVYMKKKHHGKKYKKEKKHHEDNGNHYGHDNDHGNGHGKGHGKH